jgi:predicted site-specific integrase-resolvase
VKNSDLESFDDWRERHGFSRSTAWRYRKLGVIVAVNMFGRWYVTREEADRFEARLRAGEFSQVIAPLSNRIGAPLSMQQT